MSGPQTYSSCCRLCLNEPLVPKSIFDDSVEDRGLQQKISVCLGVEIQVDDKLPTIVCSQCIDKINNWQLFKITCCENQTKLEQWLHMSTSDLSDGNIQIKEEPIDHLTPEVIINGEVPIKNEPMEEEYNELPPPLTPQGSTNGDVEVVSHSPIPQDSINGNLEVSPREVVEAELEDDPRKCEICGKYFSSAGNRKKHQRMLHGIKSFESATDSEIGSLSQDDRSQSSVDSQAVTTKEVTTEEQKILFAAGLKLLQTNSTPPIAFENLSKIETSYIDKCKAMVSMHQTLQCACHNVLHPNLKGLLSHLRALRIWFPVFTCYHCMITFTDRSTSTRHYLKCPRSNLETLVKLSNLKKRSEVKTRLYQNYKCTQCRFMYSFHEDFCTHVDEDHSNVRLPLTCSCGRIFNSLEDYKDHAYISCLVEFYCDICFVTVKTLDAFQKHAAEVHDNSEGFVLLQEDNYKQRKFSNVIEKTMNTRRSIKREHTDESNIITGKRRSSYKPPILESEDSSDDKVINPMFKHKIPGTQCPVCHREYSNNNNMWRHYKSHFEEDKKGVEVDNSIYCCPDCGGIFSTAEWEKHKESHKSKACKECGKMFQFQSELDQHRSVHLNLKLYRDSKTQNYKSTMLSPNTTSSNIVVVCDICDRMFTSKQQLQEHKKATHEKMPVLPLAEKDAKPKKFFCKECNKQYSGYGGLWDHNKKKHPEKKGYQQENFPKKCDYCERIFVTGGSYFMHLQMHERHNHSKAALDTKPQTSTEEDTNEDDAESYHTCKKCFKVFSNRSNLKNHMKSHGSPAMKSSKKSSKKVWCDVCHCAFDNSAHLEKHKTEGHKSDNDDGMPVLSSEETLDPKTPFVFTCDVCVQNFTTKAGLKRHKEKHAKEVKPPLTKTKVICKYCRIPFESAFLLSEHMKDEHMEEVKEPKPQKRSVKTFNCKLCGKQFNSSSAMLVHQGWHKRTRVDQQLREQQNKRQKVSVKEENKDVAVLFQCGTCSAVLSNDTALQIHILEKHRNVNATILPARCSMCNLDFGSQDEYEQHKRFHAMVEKQPKGKSHNCTQCPAGFGKAELLKNHIRQFHKDSQEHRCHYCERVFEKANSLSIHLKVHEKQKMVTGAVKTSSPVPKVAAIPATKPSTVKPLYCCSICNKGFDVPKDLRVHTIQAHPF